MKLILITALLALTAAAQTTEPTLTPAQTAAIKRKIATLHSASDRRAAQSWSNAKKVAETLCRPAALPILKKTTPSIDKVFLGTDDPATLTLESNKRLTGSGQYRIGYQWTDFTFACDIDPRTARVTSFTITPKPAHS